MHRKRPGFLQFNIEITWCCLVLSLLFPCIPFHPPQIHEQLIFTHCSTNTFSHLKSTWIIKKYEWQTQKKQQGKLWKFVKAMFTLNCMEIFNEHIKIFLTSEPVISWVHLSKYYLFFFSFYITCLHAWMSKPSYST